MTLIATNFKVVSVSQNHNSFGLHGVVICDPNGVAFEVGISLCNLPKRGQNIPGSITDTNNLAGLVGYSYELPRKMQKPSKAVVKEIMAITE